MDVQECFERILRVAGEVANTTRDTDVPYALLQLRDVLECQELGGRELRSVKEQIWKCDLIHIIVEVLRQDFTLVEGRWDTAAQLVSILSSICTGFNPKVQTKPDEETQSDVEQVKEYYEILLPTAVDSVLILANTLLEIESAGQLQLEGKPSTTHLDYFQSVIDSLLWFCAGHKQCIPRILQSPYLLHILITDNLSYCEVLIPAMRKLVKANKSSLSSIPLDVLQNILDELVYKLSGKGKRTAVLSLKLLANIVHYSPNVLEVVLSRYKGLHTVVLQFKNEGLGQDVDQFIAKLEMRAATNTEAHICNQAAVAIQAAWRGYTTRKKIKTVHKGIQRFQQLYRKKKAERLRRKEEQIRMKSSQAVKQELQKSSWIKFHEKQMAILEQLPASDVDRFMQTQKIQAATTIQSWWRSKQAQKRYNMKRKEIKCAVVLQRTVRQFLQRRKKSQNSAKQQPIVFPVVEGAERELLQGVVAQYRELHPVTYHTASELQQLHREVQDHLSEFYHSRSAQRKADEHRTLLLSQLNRDCELLLSAPSVSAASSSDVTTYSSRSASIARMAEMAHQEELKAMDLPWWKKPQLDLDEISLS